MPRRKKRSPSRLSSKSSSYSSSCSSKKKADKNKSRSRSNRCSYRRRSSSRKGKRKRSRDRSRDKRGGKRSQSKELDAKRTGSKNENTKASSPNADWKKHATSEKTKLPMRVLAHALSVLKKDAKAVEQKRLEAERQARQVAEKEWQTKAQQRPREGKNDDIRSKLICAHPECEFKVHTDPSVSESFCCGYCEFCFVSEPRGEPAHGRRCESIVAGKDAERAKPSANGVRAAWGPDNSDKTGREGKGKGRGRREEEREPLVHDYSRTNAMVGREEKCKRKCLRAWSDDEDLEATPDGAKAASMDESGLVACAHPLCNLAKHSDSSVSEKFCCKACAACFEQDASWAPWNHGKKCEHISVSSKK